MACYVWCPTAAAATGTCDRSTKMSVRPDMTFSRHWQPASARVPYIAAVAVAFCPLICLHRFSQQPATSGFQRHAACCSTIVAHDPSSMIHPSTLYPGSRLAHMHPPTRTAREFAPSTCIASIAHHPGRSRLRALLLHTSAHSLLPAYPPSYSPPTGAQAPKPSGDHSPNATILHA